MIEIILLKLFPVFIKRESMIKINKTILIVFVKLLFVLLLGYYILTTLSYPLFYREQQQLFLFDFSYLNDLLSQVSGLSILVSRFLVQFFYSPILAVLITLFLLILVSWLTERILQRLISNWVLVFLSMIPAVFFSVLLLDNCFFYQGLISYVAMLIVLDFYSQYLSNPKGKKFFGGLLLILLCYYFIGPTALLLSLSMFVFDLLKSRKIITLSICYPIAVLCLGWLVVRLGLLGSYRYAFTPEGYYEMTAQFPFFYHSFWFSFPVLLILASILNFIFEIKKVQYLGLLIIVLLFVFVSYIWKHAFHTIYNPTMNKYAEYEYYTVNEKWKQLTNSILLPIQNQNDANYLNLSLVMQNKLVDDLFKYPQFGPRSLIFIPNQHVRDERLAHLLFTMGNISAAQNMAFNASLSLNGYNPTMLKMIIQIELMRGSYDVALKYIELLEKSFHYADWATKQRPFLYRDDLILNDSILSEGRKSFPKEDNFVLCENEKGLRIFPRRRRAFPVPRHRKV